jgi:hypothetical protein
MLKQIKDLGTEKTIPADTDLIPFQQTDGVTGHITRANFLSGITSGSNDSKYIQLLDQRASGVNGGTPTTGSWSNRIINTIATDQTSEVTLSSNNFILPSGNYWIDVKAFFYRALEVQLRLFDVTENALILTGINNYVGNIDAGLYTSLSGFFVVGSGKSLAIQYRCNNAVTGIGLGLANSFGNEIYLIADIWKL